MYIDIDDVAGLENLLEEIKDNQSILAKALFQGTAGYAEILQEEFQGLLRGRRHTLPPGVTVHRKGGEGSVWVARVSALDTDLFHRYPKKYEEAIDDAVRFLRTEVAGRTGILLDNTRESDVDVIVEAVYG